MILILAAALLFPACLASAETLTGKVLAVTDGDTVTVLSPQNEQNKIRLADINAPKKAQAFDRRSKEKMSDLVFGKVSIADKDAGLALVLAGLAWHYKKYEKEQSPTDRERYAAAEVRARTTRVGLWAAADSVPPWEWRAERRGK